jgi:hypothetical protein
MAFIAADNSIANRFPYPSLLQEVCIVTDCLGDLPNPPGPDFSYGEFTFNLTGTAALSGSSGLPEHPGVVGLEVLAAGDDASLSLPRNQFDASASAVRIGAVIRFNALTDNNTVAGVGSALALPGVGGPRVQFVAQVGSGSFLCETNDAAPQTTSVGTLNLGQWYRMEIVSIGTTNRFYLDGVLVATHENVTVTVDSVEGGIDAPAAVGTAGQVSLDLLYAVQSGLNR